MKSATVILVLWAGLAVGILTASDLCKDKNNFLAMMEKEQPAGVTIYEEPKFITDEESQYCGSEWKTHGTCCDGNELVNMFEYERDIIEYNLRKLSQPIRNQRKSGPSDLRSRRPKKESLPKEMLNFPFEMEKCWNHIVSLRGSALCSICSGRSQHYFDPKNKKILIDSSHCRSVVENCEGFFTSLTQVVNQIAENLKKTLNSGDPNSYWTYLATTLKEYGPPKDLINAINLYDRHKADANRTGLHSAKVCSMIFNIRKKPYIVALDSMSQFISLKASISRKYGRLPQHLDKVEDFNNDQIAKIKQTYVPEFEHLDQLSDKRITEITQMNLTDSEKSDLIEKENNRNSESKSPIRARRRVELDNLNVIYLRKIDDLKKRYGKRMENLIEEINKARERLLPKDGKAGTSQVNPNKDGSSNWSKPRALSENSFFVNDLFVSDSSVLIAQTDSMFTSFDGAPGTTLAIDNGYLRSANLTLRFP